MADLMIPMPKPFNDETQRKVEGLQAAPVPSPEQDKQAREAQAFAWAPNQAKQTAGIGQTREQTTVQRAETTATLQQVQATKQQIKQTEQQIATEQANLSNLRQQSSQLSSEVASMRGQLSSLRSQVASITAAAEQAAKDAEARVISSAPTTPAAQPPIQQSLASPSTGPGSELEARSIAQYKDPNFVPRGMVGVFKKADGMTVRSDDGVSWYQADGNNQRVPGGATGFTTQGV